MQRLLTLGLVLVYVAIAALGQDGLPTNNMRARELFYAVGRTGTASSNVQSASVRTGGAQSNSGSTKAGPSTSAASNVPSSNGGRGTTSVTPVGSAQLALRYKVLRLSGTEFQEVDTDTNFSSGDQIKVSVAVNDAAYVYVAQLGSSGTWKVLFPTNELANATNLINGYEDVEFPPKDAAFRFDATPGIEQLFIAVSRQPIANLEEVIAGNRKSRPQTPPPAAEKAPVQFVQNLSGGEINASVVNALLRTRDLQISKVDTNASGSREHAVYLTNAKDGAAPVIAEFKLKHRP